MFTYHIEGRYFLLSHLKKCLWAVRSLSCVTTSPYESRCSDSTEVATRNPPPRTYRAVSIYPKVSSTRVDTLMRWLARALTRPHPMRMLCSQSSKERLLLQSTSAHALWCEIREINIKSIISNTSACGSSFASANFWHSLIYPHHE